MKVKSIIRIACIVSLLAILMLELFFVQSDSLKWYDWLLLGYSAIFVIPSLIKEFVTNEENKDDIEFEFDVDFGDGYVYTRIINAVLMGCVIWKSFLLSQVLPVPLPFTLCLIICVGLYTIFNTLYYFISLLMTGCIGFVMVSNTFVVFWQIIVLLMVVMIGTGIMIYVYGIVMERDDARREGNMKNEEIRKLKQTIKELEEKLKWINIMKVAKLLIGLPGDL